MRKTRKCAFCGKEFTCNSGSQRYCSEHCAEAAKAQRKKRQQDFLKAVQPVIDVCLQIGKRGQTSCIPNQQPNGIHPQGRH